MTRVAVWHMREDADNRELLQCRSICMCHKVPWRMRIGLIIRPFPARLVVVPAAESFPNGSRKSQETVEGHPSGVKTPLRMHFLWHGSIRALSKRIYARGLYIHGAGELSASIFMGPSGQAPSIFPAPEGSVRPVVRWVWRAGSAQSPCGRWQSPPQAIPPGEVDSRDRKRGRYWFLRWWRRGDAR